MRLQVVLIMALMPLSGLVADVRYDSTTCNLMCGCGGEERFFEKQCPGDFNKSDLFGNFQKGVQLKDPTNISLCDQSCAAEGAEACSPNCNFFSTCQRNCCVCTYMKLDCDTRNEQACNRNLADNHCWWDGTKCVNRFKGLCEQWLGEQKKNGSCNVGTMIEDDYWDSPRPPRVRFDPAAEITPCTKLKFNRFGHGFGCGAFVDRIKVCLDTLAASSSCASASFYDYGCAVFSNLEEASAAMNTLSTCLSGTQCIKVKAKQCSAVSDDTAVEYTITSSTVCSTLPECSAGSWCHDSGEGASCLLNGAEAFQICKCEKIELVNPPDFVGPPDFYESCTFHLVD